MSKMEAQPNWEEMVQREVELVIKEIQEGKKTSIELFYAPFLDKDLLKIFNELKNSNTITKVSYRGYFGHEEVSLTVAEGFGALMRHGSVKALSFENTSFVNNAFATFCSKAELGINLTSLSFRQVKFGGDGAGLMAKLEKNQSLTNLTISDCNLTNKDLMLIEGTQPLLAELTACELGAIAKGIIGEAASEFECL